MSPPKTIGFPRMLKERGEWRVFLPEFIQHLTRQGLVVCLEEGYGARSGLSIDDFRQGNEAVRKGSREEAFAQDLVLVLRSPHIHEFKRLRPGACLISMLHFPTRPKRVAELQERKVNAISLDCITNDRNLRKMENMRAVAWNGLETAFDVLEKRWPDLTRPDGEPIRVLILGSGMVGKHAVVAATKLGNVARNAQHVEQGRTGVIAVTAGRNLTGNSREMERLFRECDILVDATQRRDTARPVVPNAWLAWLPDHAIVTDLAVDPYTLDTTPPLVRGIEGIPQGSLDKYIFAPDDPDWDRTVPSTIPSRERRTVVSCYSWPGLHPEACMRHYGHQLVPLLEPLLLKGYDGLSMEGGYFERALCRATLHTWLQTGHYGARPR
jgi:alanine dehydrogenase